MPAIMLKNVAAGTANALDGLRFQEVGPNGALVTLYASTATAGGNVDFSVGGGDQDVLRAAEVNIEASADVVDTDRDLVLKEEPVPPGKMFLGANDQIINFLLVIEEL